ncbi:aldehyde dehydrogenase family protein [Marinobacter salexigens]|uniref:aldehyde dehydrogenase family protein n=1 Tax=Marinobacter salexigens TaxID=1925763 RepID=UPI003F541DE9
MFDRSQRMRLITHVYHTNTWSYYPIAMITQKVASTLAAGFTVVIKPGEDTPLGGIH